MYVVIAIINGELKSSANFRNATEAMETAQEWARKYREKHVEGYIAVDEQIRGKEENRRFAKVTFEEEPENVKFYIRAKGENPLLSSKISPAVRVLLVTFINLALVEAQEFLKENKSRRY